MPQRMALLASRSVSPPLWSRLKYLNNYWMDWHEILYRNSWSPEDEANWLKWSTDCSFSVTMRLTFLFLSDLLCDSYWMDFNEIWIQITMLPKGLILMTLVISCFFPLTPPAGQSFLILWNISTSTWWTGTKFCTDFHGSQTMDPNDFDDFSSGAIVRFCVDYHEIW